MKLLLLCVLAVLPLLVVGQVPIPWTNCGVATDHVKVSSATASVWPPVPGQAMTITLAGALDESLPGGSYIVTVFLDGFQLLSQQGELSSLANVTWPIPAGPISLTKTLTVPSIVPANSSILINASALDSNGQELICLSLPINIGDVSEEYVPEFELEPLPELPEEPIYEEQSPLFSDEYNSVVEEASLADMAEEGEVEYTEQPASFEEGLAQLVHANVEKLNLKHVAADVLTFLAGEMRQITEQVDQPEDATPVPFKNCGQPSDEISILNITSTEWPPVLGTTATLLINAVANTQIADGTYTAVVSVDGFPLVTKTGDISKYFKLPIVAGPVTITKNIKLPDLPISGSVGIQLSATDVNGNEMFCLTLVFTL